MQVPVLAITSLGKRAILNFCVAWLEATVIQVARYPR